MPAPNYTTLVIKSPDNCYGFENKAELLQTNKIQNKPQNKTNKTQNKSTKNNKITRGFVDIQQAAVYTENMGFANLEKERSAGSI